MNKIDSLHTIDSLTIALLQCQNQALQNNTIDWAAIVLYISGGIAFSVFWFSLFKYNKR